MRLEDVLMGCSLHAHLYGVAYHLELLSAGSVISANMLLAEVIEQARRAS